MSAVIKYLLIVLALAAVGFAIYAAVADLPPPSHEVVAPAPPPDS